MLAAARRSCASTRTRACRHARPARRDRRGAAALGAAAEARVLPAPPPGRAASTARRAARARTHALTSELRTPPQPLQRRVSFEPRPRTAPERPLNRHASFDPRLDRGATTRAARHRHHHSGHSHRSDGGGSGGPLGTPGSTARSSRGGHSSRRLDPEGQAAWAKLVARAQALEEDLASERASKRMLSERAAAEKEGLEQRLSTSESEREGLRQLWKHTSEQLDEIRRTLHVRLGARELERHALYQEVARLRDGGIGGGGGGGDGGGGATDAAAGGPAPFVGSALAKLAAAAAGTPAALPSVEARRRESAMQAHRDAARAARFRGSLLQWRSLLLARCWRSWCGHAVEARLRRELARIDPVDAISPGGATENAQILASLAAASDLVARALPSTLVSSVLRTADAARRRAGALRRISMPSRLKIARAAPPSVGRVA